MTWTDFDLAAIIRASRQAHLLNFIVKHVIWDRKGDIQSFNLSCCSQHFSAGIRRIRSIDIYEKICVAY